MFSCAYLPTTFAKTTTYSNSNTWSNHANNYTAHQIASSTAQAVEELISLAHSIRPLSASASVLDNGAGTGSLTVALTARFPGTRILAADIAPTTLEALDAKRLPSVETKVIDACVENGELRGQSFSHALSTFMVQFAPWPASVVREICPVFEPDGLVVFGTWLRTGVNEPWDAACRRLDPDFVPMSTFDATAWKGEGDVEAALKDRRLQSRICKPVEFTFYSTNPGMLRVRSAWKGDIEEVRATVNKAIMEEFDGARDIEMCALLTIAVKLDMVACQLFALSDDQCSRIW